MTLEPTLAVPTGPAPGPTPEPAEAAPAPLFRSDAATGVGVSDAALDLLGDLAAHRRAETPLTIGLFGGAGAGKSHALRHLASRVAALAAGAGAGSPFLSRILCVFVQASDLRDEPVAGLAKGVHDALVAAGSDSAYATLARDAAHAASDPQTAARDAAERLDAVRRRLDDDRRALDDLEGRRARLSESVLYDSAGTQIDAYARRNRARLEARLRGFGFTGEPLATYKDLVRDLADHPGAGSRFSAFLRSLWAFEGQTKLIVWAIVFFLMAWGLGLADQTRGTWLSSLRGTSESAVGPANWIEAHATWFSTLRQAAIFAAILCLVANVWRAIRFVMPLTRGARLLEADVDKRRHDLDGLIAHQTRRVDQLAAEVDAQARRAQEAERRARESETQGASLDADLPFESEGPTRTRLALGYLTALQQGMKGAGAPQRIAVFIDGLDALEPREAASVVDGLHRILDRPGVVTVLAADPEHLAAGWGSATETSARLERYVQAPLTLKGLGDSESIAAYARKLLTGIAEAPARTDASRSPLDVAIEPGERELLTALAPLAGGTPRAIKRYLNIYRLARPRTSEHGALALMLALDSGGTSGELAAMAAAVDLQDPLGTVTIHPGEPRLTAAVAAVNAGRSAPLTSAEAHAAWMIARDYRTPSA